MNVRSVEYTIYNNLFKYLDIIKFVPEADKEEKEGSKGRKDKNDFIKTLQFYSYVKVRAKNKAGEIMYVFLLSDNGFVSKSLEFKKLLNTISEKDVHLIIISEDGIKTPVKKFLLKYDKKKLRVKDLKYNHFKVDPRKNALVPKHQVCTEEETRKAMYDNKIDNINMFPKIRRTDTQVLWSGGTVGQLIRIERNTVIGQVLYYRVIV